MSVTQTGREIETEREGNAGTERTQAESTEGNGRDRTSVVERKGRNFSESFKAIKKREKL